MCRVIFGQLTRKNHGLLITYRNITRSSPPFTLSFPFCHTLFLKHTHHLFERGEKEELPALRNVTVQDVCTSVLIHLHMVTH